MELSALVEQGAANPFFLLGSPLVLGAVQGLEPGHSKTMMAAFVIAVRGTAPQAPLLGLSTAISHSVIVWILTLLALTYGDRMIGDKAEPWFITVSGVIILGVAAWVFLQTWWSQSELAASPRQHDHTYDHGHSHDHDYGHSHDHDPSLSHEDRHARAHARKIEARFGSGKATTSEVVLFGLTGGLIPCAAAVTVLLICLQLQKFGLGVALVTAFSAGLAVTLVAVGCIAAVGLSAARKRTSRLDTMFANAPYVSSVLIAASGVVMVVSGVDHLSTPH